MILLTRDEAIKAMREGKTVGFVGIPGIEMCLHEGSWLFKHRDGTIESLNSKTFSDDDGYCIVNRSNKHMHVKVRKFHSLY